MYGTGLHLSWLLEVGSAVYPTDAQGNSCVIWARVIRVLMVGGPVGHGL